MMEKTDSAGKAMDLHRANRRQYSTEEQTRIVLRGLAKRASRICVDRRR